MIRTAANRIAVRIMKIETKKPRGEEIVDLPLIVKFGIGLWKRSSFSIIRSTTLLLFLFSGLV